MRGGRTPYRAHAWFMLQSHPFPTSNWSLTRSFCLARARLDLFRVEQGKARQLILKQFPVIDTTVSTWCLKRVKSVTLANHSYLAAFLVEFTLPPPNVASLADTFSTLPPQIRTKDRHFRSITELVSHYSTSGECIVSEGCALRILRAVPHNSSFH